MLISYRPYTDPYFNIAAEEYFVKHATDDICMVWINERSVIIGKHQNAYSEINYPYVRANHIPVIRRISGGGAVYHDDGNVNFTFISKTVKTNQVDFGRFTSILALFMQSFGIEINVSKRNSLFIGNLKFSGHAEHIFHDRVLHHGTILFNTDLEALQNSLNPKKEYHGKAMSSVRSEVCSIAPLLPENIDIHQFVNQFVTWLKEYYAGSTFYDLNENELEAIIHLSETKYRTWQWNFGYSPAYRFLVDIPTVTGSFPILLSVKNGKFVGVDLQEAPKNNEISDILNSLTGVLHEESEIDEFVKKNRLKLELTGINTVTFTEAFFR